MTESDIYWVEFSDDCQRCFRRLLEVLVNLSKWQCTEAILSSHISPSPPLSLTLSFSIYFYNYPTRSRNSFVTEGPSNSYYNKTIATTSIEVTLNLFLDKRRLWIDVYIYIIFIEGLSTVLPAIGLLCVSRPCLTMVDYPRKDII